jgi:hypothetical protein
MRMAAPPLPVIRRPRNWKRTGLWPTANMPSCRLYFTSMSWKAAKVGVGGQRRADFDFAVVAELGADKLRGLQGALERAGDDDVHLHLEGAQHARHQHALLLAFLDQAALGVESGVLAEQSGIGVAHEVEDHGEQSGGDSCGTNAVQVFDINTTVTIG